MKRISLVMLLLMPSGARAQQTDEVQTVPHPVVQSAPVEASNDPFTSAESEVAIAAAAEQALLPRYRPVAASPGGWFGDVGFYVLRPQWSGGNPAFATTTSTTRVAMGNPIVEDQSVTWEQTEFDHGASFAPLVSLGYAGRNGLGVRARWWTLEASDSVGGSGPTGALVESLPETVTASYLVPSLLGTTSALDPISEILNLMRAVLDVEGSFRSRLDLDVIDAEAIWDTTLGRSSLLVSAGVRYAHIGQSFDGDLGLTSTTSNSLATTTLRSQHTFNGAGPTVSLQAYRTIGQTNLSVYGLSRGSLLFGESRQRATTTVEGTFPWDFIPIDRTLASSTSLNSNSLRPVMELEVGTNWTRSLGTFDLFAESGLVGMVWFSAGNAANSETLVGSGFRAIGSDSTQHHLGLIGLRFSTGVRF